MTTQKQSKTRIATKKAIANFMSKFNLDETEIASLLGKTYMRKLEKSYRTISDYIKFKFKILPENGETSNQDIADLIKGMIDKRINSVIMICRNPEEYNSLTNFLNVLPRLKEDIMTNGQTLLSKYPAISMSVLGMFEQAYTESEEFWKRGETTAAMILSPLIRDYADIPMQVHCYTQSNGDVLITTEKIEHHNIATAKSTGNSGCLIIVLLVFILGLGLFAL